MTDYRSRYPTMVYGRYESVREDYPAVLAYLRTSDEEGERLLVVLNFTGGEQSLEIPGDVGFDGTALLVGNYDADVAGSAGPLDLRPYEARVYELT